MKRILTTAVLLAASLFLVACGGGREEEYTPMPPVETQPSPPELMIGGEATSRATEYDLRVLFVGNSFIFTNNLPQIFADLAASGGHNVYVYDVSEGGMALIYHADSRDPDGVNTLAAINDPSIQWDYVILQEQSARPILDLPSFERGARQLSETVRQVGAEPAFFMTWAMINGVDDLDFDAANLLKELAYEDVAEQNNALLLPVGTVWYYIVTYVIMEHDDVNWALSLWDASNGMHPSYMGSYLAATVFYAAIFNESPVGLAHSDNIHHYDAEFIQAFVEWFFELD